MTNHLSGHTDPKRREVYELADALLNRAITAEEADRLGKLVSDDVEARRHYVRFMHDSAALCQWGRGTLDTKQVGPEPRTPNPEPQTPNPEPRTPNPEPPFPTLSTTRYPLPTSFVDHPAFPFIAATVILGMILLVFWAIEITPHQHIAEAPSQSVPSYVRPEMVFVGRITGMVDCKFSDDKDILPPPSSNAYVPLGRKYKLDSGLMEITYDTGTKVILQGLCAYEVESSASGYLALGKLTARVESGEWRVESAKPQAANSKSQISNHSPLSTLHSPLFSVRTPTAIITDLGTEFGVEVDDSGVSAAHVFQGDVEVRVVAAAEGKEDRTIRLHENESVRIETDKSGRGRIVLRGAADPNSFVRPGQLVRLAREARGRWLSPLRRWQAYSQKLRRDPSLVAYYTFESRGRDPTLPGILPNVAATGKALDGRIEGPRWTEGRFPGKFALRFAGSGWNDRVELPKPERFNFTGPFTLAVWFKSEQSDDNYRHLLSKGKPDWRFVVRSDEKVENVVFTTGVFSREGEFNSLSKRTPYRTQSDHWCLVSGVFDPGEKTTAKRLYIDGRLEAEQLDLPRTTFVGDRPVWIGNNADWGRGGEYGGLIDEVAIFSRALSGSEIFEMYVAGNPGGSAATQADNPSRLLEKEKNRPDRNETDRVSDATVSTMAVDGGIIFLDKAAFNAATSNPAVCAFSGLTSNGSCKGYKSVKANGITIAGKNLFAVNNTREFMKTGKEVLDLGRSNAILTFPAGATAVGMELYINQDRRAKFTVTYSDGAARDYATPVQTVPNPRSRSPSFWGIASSNPAVSIVSLKSWKDDDGEGIGTPVIDWVAAGTYVPEPDARKTSRLKGGAPMNGP